MPAPIPPIGNATWLRYSPAYPSRTRSCSFALPSGLASSADDAVSAAELVSPAAGKTAPAALALLAFFPGAAHARRLDSGAACPISSRRILSYEATILMGLLPGAIAGRLLGGATLAIPAVWHGEYWTLPVNLESWAAIAGALWQVRQAARMLWSFSPMDRPEPLPVGSHAIYGEPHPRRQVLAAGADHGDAVRHQTGSLKLYAGSLFALHARGLWLEELVWSVHRSWSGLRSRYGTRCAWRCRSRNRSACVLEARLDALQRQINPHFLFNTLNSIASLVRSQPELAREMTVKLANILRALLKDHDTFVPLREELSYRRLSRYRGGSLRRRKAARDERNRSENAGGAGSQHPVAAAYREQHQARAGAAHPGRYRHAAQPAYRGPRAH